MSVRGEHQNYISDDDELDGKPLVCLMVYSVVFAIIIALALYLGGLKQGFAALCASQIGLVPLFYFIGRRG